MPEARDRLRRRPDRAGSAARYEARHQELVDIAARVFARQGYHATSIDDLVEATGLKRGGLYHYISSKEDLLIAAHERFIEPLLENARAIAAEGLGSEEALRRIAHALMHDIAAYQDQVTVFLHEWRVIRDAPAWAHVRAGRREFEQIVQSILDQGVREGVFHVRSPRLTVLGFLGMFNYSYTWYSAGGRRSPEQIADEFAGIFLGGIRAGRSGAGRAGAAPPGPA